MWRAKLPLSYPSPSFMGRVARSAGWGGSSHAEAAPTRHIARSAHDVPALPTKGGGMECAAAFPHISPISSRKTHLSDLAARCARVLNCVKPSEHQRAWGMPGARCTRSLACKIKKHTSIVTTGSPDSPGIPARHGFNGFLRDLPGDRALLSPSSCELAACPRPVGPTRLRKT